MDDLKKLAPKKIFRAYYYEFEATGDDKIDAILEAVAFAGKRYHHTNDWDEEVIGAIQRAANRASGLTEPAQ